VLLVGLEPEEMLMAAIASARRAPTLALGNVIGTNVTIVTLTLGLSALLYPLIIDQRVRRQALIATLVSIIPTMLMFVGVVTRVEGAVFLVVFGCYTFILFRSDREAVKRLAEADADDDDDEDRGVQLRLIYW
jgi:cation:H+ antiporter